MNKKNKHTYVNIICSVGVMIVNLCISFFLSPYIIRTIGIEANGFVSLANNFVTYANLVVTALNAMAARFITIAYIQQDYKKANLYYNSVFWGNLIIVAVLLFPAPYLVVKLENFINVPTELLLDVKILFSLVFFSFFVRTGAPNYDCGTYITNRMDLSYIPTMVTSLLRCILLVGMFTIWSPHVWYVTLISTVLGFLTLGISGHYTHKLTPELKVELKKPICSWKAIGELVGSGVWNAITIAGNMLMSGFDLLICNVCLGPEAMGMLSLAKVLPGILTDLSESIRGAFGPELTINYAKGNHQQLHAELKRSMKITAVVITIPAAGLIVMSDLFYALWVPAQDHELLRTLTVLTMMAYVFSSGIAPLNNVYPTANKVIYNSAGLIVSGCVSIVATLTIVKFTDYDLFAVAGVSSVIMILRDLFYNIPIASKILGMKWYTFYPQVGQSILSCAVIVGIGCIVRAILPVNNWIMFFLACGIIAILGLCANMFIVLNKEERAYLLGIVKRKLLPKL